MRDRVKIWEAVRATSAATSFFEPITIAGETFLDGATRANNPAREVWAEAVDLWKPDNDPKWRLEDAVRCIVSIGTGMPLLRAFGTNLLSVGKSLVAIATDCEQVAEEFRREHQDLVDKHRYYRFNVLRGLEDIGIEESEKLGNIRTATRNYFVSQEAFNSIIKCSSVLKERHECGYSARQTYES